MRYCRYLLTLACLSISSPAQSDEQAPKEFRIWATSCAHVPADIRRGRESLAQVIRQSEGFVKDAPAFKWDIMLDAGDLSAHQYPPGDRDGFELIRQYHALRKHRREQIYNVPGNHDSPYYDHGAGTWFKKWGDPLGLNTEFSGVDPKRRPFPVEGTWERYRFQAGNILFLMLADRNDAPEPVGRGHSKDGKSGGYPAGAVTRDTFNWWKQQVLENQDKIIITMHHHVLRDTTIASGRGEGNPRYHGASGGAEGSSYLYYLIENEDPDDFQFTSDAHVFEDFLDDFYRQHGRGAIDLWVAGHTHVRGPDDNWGDKTITETRWGVAFLQIAALTRHHAGSHPMSRLLTFVDGTSAIKADVYLHDSSFKGHSIGWYAAASKNLPLRHEFQAPPPIESLPPFPPETRITTRPYEKPAPSHSLRDAATSPDLSQRWKETGEGSLHLEAQLLADKENRIDRKPNVVLSRKDSKQSAALFDGRQRLSVGPIAMDDWTDLTVSAWINSSTQSPGMRVASRDCIGTPGTFILWHDLKESWTMQVWDSNAKRWQAASWHSHDVSDGRWHLLTGVVDSKQKKVLLFVDGQQKSESPWTAESLNDSERTDFVVGADSGKRKFGHGFVGMIHDVHLYPRALMANQIAEMYATGPPNISATPTQLNPTVKGN